MWTILALYRADSRFASNQWETALLCNDVSLWLDTNLESALLIHSGSPYWYSGNHSMICIAKLPRNTGLDTNGCPLGNSKFILLSDNLNICLWLSACQVEEMIELAWSASHNVIGALDNVHISCGHILQNFAFVGLLSIYTLCYHFSSLSSSCVVIALSGSVSLGN